MDSGGDVASALPTPESASELAAVRVQAEAQVRIQKMARDAEASMALELLKTLGVGGRLNISA